MLWKPLFALLALAWLPAAFAVFAADGPAQATTDEKPAARRANRGRLPSGGQPKSPGTPLQEAKYWKDALVPLKDEPGLPRVLLIGDSVSVCYTLATRELLKGEANVHRIPANGGTTTKSLQEIDGWLGDGHWDVIHFNWGLHDLRQRAGTTLEQYEQNLRQLVKRLQATGAKLIWCSSTPLPEDVPRSAQQTEDLLARNAVAKKIMDENGIAIDALYTFAKPRLAKLQMPKSAHFTEEGSKILAEPIARSIREAIQAPNC